MVETVWDEIWNKPAFNFLSYHPDELLRVPGKISVNEDWLKEVKAEGDRLLKRDTSVKNILVNMVERDFKKIAVADALAKIMLLYQPTKEESAVQ